MPPEMVFLGALLATVASGLMAWELRKVSKGFALLSKILDAPQVEREWLKDTLNAQTNRMRKQDELAEAQGDQISGLARTVESLTIMVTQSSSKDAEIARLVKLYEDQLAFLRPAALRNVEFEKAKEDPQAQTASAGSVRETPPLMQRTRSRFDRSKPDMDLEPALYRPPVTVAPVATSATIQPE